MVQLGAVLGQAGVTGTHMNNWTLWAFSDSAWFICCLRTGRGSANYFKTLDHSFAGKSPTPNRSLHYHLGSVFTVPRSSSLRVHCSIDHATKALLTDPRPGVRANKVRNDNGRERRHDAWGGPLWPQPAISILSTRSSNLLFFWGFGRKVLAGAFILQVSLSLSIPVQLQCFAHPFPHDGMSSAEIKGVRDEENT